MTLKKYNQKRHFKKTPEPKGKLHKKGKALRFVIQKHDASRLHYDFRLEMEGVLKSWAVPKGPSLNPDDKHLAMMVEDHPYDYRTFEGVIPEGNYGAGNVIVWDEGTYEPLEKIPEVMSAEEFLLDQLKRGTIKIIMHGKKLKGEFALFRFKTAGDKAWLLKKHDDQYASKKDILKEDESVKTGKTVDEVGIKSPAGKAHIPHEVEPMLAELADFPFDNKDWVYEIKWDGYRAIGQIHNNNVRLYSRNNIDFNERYPEIVDALKTIKHDAVIDGEIVVLDDDGKSQFQLLQDYRRHKRGHLVYYVFDLIYLDGYDTRSLPLLERKKFLKKICKESKVLKFSDHIEEHGLKLYSIAQKRGYEGIMAKLKTSKYSSHRTADWLKIKNIQTQEAIICGFTEPKGMRKEFGALILGLYDNNELRYVGHTGGGFDQQKLKEVMKMLKPLVVKKTPFTIEPPTNTPATWVKPELVCQVKFSEWTNDGVMRQPVFLGIREDKKASDVTDEKHVKVSKKGKLEEKPPKVYLQKKEEKTMRGKVEVTNLKKIYWPDEGYTKGDLIDYYDSMADYVLPYLKDRPISLNRFPNGIEGENFFQKDLIHKPEWVKTVPLFSEHDQGDIHWLICNNKDSLLYLANLGSIEINPWNSRYTNPDHPDYLIIDLDPEGISFKEVIKTAKLVKDILDEADTDCFLKTSGKTGLHILVPLKAKYTYDQAKQFAEIVANKVFAELPETTSVVRDPKKREHRIYVDFLQNRKGQTIAAPYCVRPVPKATVSTPLEWKELTSDLTPADFTIKNILKRVKKKGDIWKKFREHKGIHMLKSLKKLVE
jgi:bifunctional non-homologous end joining protein LigD